MSSFSNLECKNVFEAAKKGCVECLKKYFVQKNINKKDKDGYTILHLAVIHDQMASLKYIMSYMLYQRSINIKDRYNKPPIYYAVNKEDVNIELLSKLIREYSELNAQYEDGNTLLHISALRDDINVVKTLLEQFHNSAIPNIENNDGKTPFGLTSSKEIRYTLEKYTKKYDMENYVLSIEKRNLGNVKKYFKIFGFYFKVNGVKTPILYHAIEHDISKCDIVKFLISQGINVVNKYGIYLEKYGTGLKRGGDVFAKSYIEKKEENLNFESPLTHAVIYERYAVAKVLLEHGANPNGRGDFRINQKVIDNPVVEAALLLDENLSTRFLNLLVSRNGNFLIERIIPELSKRKVFFKIRKDRNIFLQNYEIKVNKCRDIVKKKYPNVDIRNSLEFIIEEF